MKSGFSAGMGAVAAAVALSAGAQQPQYSPGLWESTVIIERYARSDGKPSTRDKKVERICIVPGDEKSMVPMFSPDVASKLKGKCWQADSREAPGKKQVKMACESGVTAESVTRLEADGSIGSMIVLNVPAQGGLKLTGNSKKIADACPPTPAKPDTSKDNAVLPAPKQVEMPPPGTK
jgi:hypothetical protein